MVPNTKCNRTSSPSSIIVDKHVKPDFDPAHSRPSEAKTCFSTAVAANQEMAKEFSAVNDEIRAGCLAGDMMDYDDDDRSVYSAAESRAGDGHREGSESVVHGEGKSKSTACGIDMPGRCQMDLPQNCHTQNKSQSSGKERDGIDFLFELVESSFCGGCDATKKQDGIAKDMAIISKDLPVYKMMPELRKDSLTEDESAASTFIHSSRTQRTSSSRSRGRTSSRRTRQGSSRRRRPSLDDAPQHQNRSSPVLSNPRDESKKKKASEEIAKKASAFIRENVKPSKPNSLKPSSYLKQDKSSAFEKNCPARSSRAALETNDSQITEMRELCVLNIGSGSSVSSFDEDGPSRHDRNTSGSPMSVLTALTENTSNKKKSATLSHRDVSEAFHRVLRVVINFLSSLSTIMYGEGAAAPVNKTVCLLSLTVLAVFWPEDRENNRVHLEKQEIPKPEKVSLLKMVTRGGS
jgi:hypothetical protein